MDTKELSSSALNEALKPKQLDDEQSYRRPTKGHHQTRATEGNVTLEAKESL
jgi:hypothetical protein